MPRPQSLLLADDDEDIRAIAELSLRVVGGMQVTLAASGRAAIEHALQKRPDVILLDMMMPEMDGLETLRQMRGYPSLASLPVIFMTAKVQERDLALYLLAGAAGVITKPFDPMQLANQVRGLLAANGSTSTRQDALHHGTRDHDTEQR